MYNKSSIKIGIVSASNVEDKRSWSGTHFRMLSALRKQFESVSILGPIQEPLFVRFVNRLKDLFHFSFLGGRYAIGYNKLLSRYYARKIEKKLKNEKPDVLFAPAASIEVAELKTDIPLCYISDTSYEQIRTYYGEFNHLSKRAIEEGNAIEQSAILKASALVYSSEWAADFVTDFYKAEKSKIHILSFGANIDKDPELNSSKSFDEKIVLVFLGVNWKRKGGAMVLETFEQLYAKGYDVKLYIIGCTPPVNIENKAIEVIPFLNKNLEEDYNRFDTIMQNAHLLFVPTRADCTPIVFCEANAYGLPVITTDTGGVTSIITNGENGFALPYNASATDYSNLIEELLQDRQQIKNLSEQARKKYKRELNWDNWGKAMRVTLSDLVK